MGLALEILGLVIFLGAHVFVTMREHRAALVARIGEWPYRGLFSLVSIVGIVLVGYGFAAYRSSALKLDEFEGPQYQRIAHIKILLAKGLVSSELRVLGA